MNGLDKKYTDLILYNIISLVTHINLHNYYKYNVFLDNIQIFKFFPQQQNIMLYTMEKYVENFQFFLQKISVYAIFLR